jgi:hypothetical protein
VTLLRVSWIFWAELHTMAYRIENRMHVITSFLIDRTFWPVRETHFLDKLGCFGGEVQKFEYGFGSLYFIIVYV